MSRDLSEELRTLQELLASGPAASYATAPPLPPQALQPADDSSSSFDEEQLPLDTVRKIKAVKPAPSAQQTVQMAELERQLTATRHQLAEEGSRSHRLEQALEAARQDCTVVGSRLRSELAAKQEEVGAGCISG